mmetsp:Transcript_130212/g.417932  ORF Transcript_130212/g.417932 Transcript_130212/m.417932 type:complete len:454 (-) Transcript_130212:581-1942(-)
MACKAAPFIPFTFFRGRAGGDAPAGSVADPVSDTPYLTADALCGALADAVARVQATSSHVGGTQASSACGPHSAAPEEVQDSATEAVQRSLGAVLRRLEEVLNVASLSPPRSPSYASRAGTPVKPTTPVTPMSDALSEDDKREGCALVEGLLSVDAPAQLLGCLHLLCFESRKDAMRLFSALLRSALPLGADAILVDYLRSHLRIFELLLEGSGHPEVFTHCAHMIRACTRYPQLVEALLREGAARRLMDLASHQSFDISSEAFSSLRELMLAQRPVSAQYMTDNFAEFFAQCHTLLQPDMDYVARRQALRLLGDMLLDRTFMGSMLAYVSNEQFLQIHMNLLRDSSKTIQLDAFHVFKIFVANPQKPARVLAILCKNRERLLKLLGSLSGKSDRNASFEEDLRTVITVLKALEAPAPRRPPAAAAAVGPAEGLRSPALDGSGEVGLNTIAAA